eukprot:GDKI01018934.1.p1 GENE.GDKI01018934.1~~GDKI01018934.1.p1  ORF type:complete len:236 (-),score=10.35 GDKI01018934.1:218-925(-)
MQRVSAAVRLSLPQRMSLIRNVIPSIQTLPQRALPLKKKPAKPTEKKQSKQVEVTEIRLVPYLPPELVKETVSFFSAKPKLKGLLDLLFSPIAPTDTETERLEYQRRWEAYDEVKQRVEARYRAQEERLQASTLDAIQNLPEDLHNEAIQNEPVPPPKKLLFNEMYREQIFKHELTERELVKLQVFQNLMYVRFPHTETKRREPEKFWLPESQAMSRQKMAALRGKQKKLQSKKK